MTKRLYGQTWPKRTVAPARTAGWQDIGAQRIESRETEELPPRPKVSHDILTEGLFNGFRLCLRK
jgi:hypothetical protein